MLLVLLALVLAACAWPAAAAAQAPVAPSVETAPARDVGRTTATLVGTVDPRGSGTLHRFHYGTSDAYGEQTAEQAAGPRAGRIEVTTAVTGLQPGTTYHYRVVAANAAGESRGADATFTTLVLPGISRLRLDANSPTDPIVRAVVNPRGSTTTWRIEYGPTPALGESTPDVEIGADAGPVLVSAALPGRQPGSRIHWRVVATSAAGTQTSRTARFTTQRAPTAVALGLEPATVPWGDRVLARGQVAGAGIGGIVVALVREAFPFGTGLTEVATTAADPAGVFAFDAGPLLVTTRFQVQTRTPVLAQSAVLTAYSAVRVTVATGRRTRRRVAVTGTVQPPVSSGLAALQRLGAGGAWTTVRRARLADVAAYSRYRFAVPRLRRARDYRVVVDPRDGGAHVAAASSVVRVPARPARPRRRDRRPDPRPRRRGDGERPDPQARAAATIRLALG